MILNFKEGCIASGRVTKKGAELEYFGKNNTPKYKFSICVYNEKDENDEWNSTYLNCEFIGKYAESAPEIQGGDIVFCTGKLEKRPYEAKDGSQKTAINLKCEFISIQKKSSKIENNSDQFTNFMDTNENDFSEVGEIENENDLPF